VAVNEQLAQAVRQARRQYGRAYIAEINNEVFVFRPLTRQEYEEILMFSPNEDAAEEAICKTAVVFPVRYDFSNSKAGVVPFLRNEIIQASGFHDQNKIAEFIDMAREMMSSFHEQAITVIATAFPQMRMEEIESLPVEKLMKYLARAEWALQNIHGKNIEFRRKVNEGEEGEESQEEKLTLTEIAKRLREQGIDPMLHFGPPPKKPYVEFPLIGGTKVWQNEELFKLVGSNVRKSISGLPGQRHVLPEVPSGE
jgi:hypothetical protein